MEKHEAYIKAMTSFGGDEERDFAQYYTDEYEQALEEWLVEQPKATGITLFRGYKFDARFFEDCNLNEGEIVTPWALTAFYHPAFTTDTLRAVKYINEFGNAYDEYVKVLFELRTSGKYMVNVSELSHYPEENEYHATKDARFKVVSNKRTGGFYTITLEEIQ